MEPSKTLSPEGITMLNEGISLVLGRWTALQMAVAEQWGGRDSRAKADKLAEDILSWFTQAKPPLYIDDLEELMDSNMFQSLNAEIDDGSIEEIAEQLMLMHEGCLEGNYESIHRLRQLGPQTNSLSQSQMVVNEGDDDESSDEEGSDSDAMAIDEETGTDPLKNDNNKPVPDPEGWTVVANKKNKGRRSN